MNKMKIFFISLSLIFILSQNVNADQIKSAYSKIMKAASENNLEIAKEAISEGGKSILNPPACPPNAICSPLVYAAEEGHTELLEYMLKSGANPNYVNAYGNTPILYAAMRNKVDSIKVLMHYGADINQSNSFGASVFKLSCMYGNEMIDTMINKYNADINKVYNNNAVKTQPQNTTALMSFAEKCPLSSIKKLVDNGADISIKDSNGMAAFDYAEKAKRDDVVNYLSGL